MDKQLPPHQQMFIDDIVDESEQKAARILSRGRTITRIGLVAATLFAGATAVSTYYRGVFRDQETLLAFGAAMSAIVAWYAKGSSRYDAEYRRLLGGVDASHYEDVNVAYDTASPDERAAYRTRHFELVQLTALPLICIDRVPEDI